MKALYLIFLLSTSTQLFATPLQEMDRRLNLYAETQTQICAPGDKASSDDGLFVDVTCEFECAQGPIKLERSRGAFIPRNQGLFPGNGSNEQNILWSAVGVSLRMWSKNICFEKAAEGCQGINKVKNIHVKELESGKWKLNRFPGCNESGITLSPFNESVESSRIPRVEALLSPFSGQHDKKKFGLKVSGLDLSVPVALLSEDSKSCGRVIKGSLCFGDCVDLNPNANKEILETLGTNDPLGREEVFICGDALYAKLEKQNLSSSVRRDICESYFWDSLLKHENNMIKSCAAIRGETTCENF
jgi:hypothetical protein